GSGVGDLLDEIVQQLKKAFETSSKNYDDHLKIGFVGKPNVGKSSLINALIKQERLLVHEKAGTTRSTVEVPFIYGDKKFLLHDTAGIKKKWKSDSDVAAAAAMQSLRTMSSVDVVFFVLDASSPIASQDQTIAGQIEEQELKVIVLLNKIDLISENEQQTLLDRISHYLPKLWWAPVVLVSAKDALGLKKMLQLATEISENAKKEIEQETLDRFLDRILKNHFPGKMDDQREPKVYSFKQIKADPPIFKLTVNFPAALAKGWKNLFEKQFRLEFGFEGSPIVIRYAKKS
ncbi:MAG: GTP-binding protein, partial [bacterium]|nr:GTP-binding protein [bacterium]